MCDVNLVDKTIPPIPTARMSSPDKPGEHVKKRRTRCGQCGPCQIKNDCGQCKHCLNKAVLKQSCIYRKCLYLRCKPSPGSDFLRAKSGSNAREQSEYGQHEYMSPQSSSEYLARQSSSDDSQNIESPGTPRQVDYPVPPSPIYRVEPPSLPQQQQQQQQQHMQQPQSPAYPQTPNSTATSPTWSGQYNNNNNAYLAGGMPDFSRVAYDPNFIRHSPGYAVPSFVWDWQVENFRANFNLGNQAPHNTRDKVRNFLFNKPPGVNPQDFNTGTAAFQVPRVRDPLIGGNLAPEPFPAQGFVFNRANGLHTPNSGYVTAERGGPMEQPHVTQEECLISVDDTPIQAFVQSDGFNTIEITTLTEPDMLGFGSAPDFHPDAKGEVLENGYGCYHQVQNKISSNIILRQDLGEEGEIQINLPPTGITIQDITLDDELSKFAANTADIFKVSDTLYSQIS
ncbi:uncharacterized protein LOC106175909 isoform X2 [Lingula anatina]|uniref:Uncharacterized protein LOC106175909 isoform X2 n=1 Tax=Lingula anatina TaxID=7574 RepID=A0A1S3JT81_LINAN|nr:uncharacterized protein LOC106175909 isoform X2 [Lingula anatina]|eukprot:XP_013413523.1 uncharacterized protein LOC106175909 isoform X2 [Lingula anatina]